MTQLYLDHNATTPVDPRVLQRFVAVESECPGNPASVHAAGRRARAVVEDARRQVAAALGCVADDVIFVSGGTEANNLAVRGLGDTARPVLCAAVEHPSVMEPAARRGVVTWDVEPAGRAVPVAPSDAVGLICLAHAQSEVGTLQPVVVAADLANKLEVPLHVDAAQTLGRVALDEVMARADSVTLSPHKCGGLRGAGILVVRHAAHALRPLLLGGGQERGLRPGTVSPALVASAALAVELAQLEHPARRDRMGAARAAFVAAIAECRLTIVTPLADSIPNTVMVAVDAVDGRALLPALDLAGIAVSQGSACSTGSPQPPRVLTAMGLHDDLARACIRISFGPDDDATTAVEAAARLTAVVERLRKKK